MRNVILVCVLAALGYAISSTVISSTASSRPRVEHGDFSRVTEAYESDVVLFTTTTCVYCAKEKAFLDSHGVAFREVRVDLSSDDRDYLLEELDRDSIPVLVARDQLLAGFDESELTRFFDGLRR